MEYIFGFGSKDFFEPVFFILFIVLSGLYGVTWLTESSIEDDRREMPWRRSGLSRGEHLFTSYLAFAIIGSLTSVFYFNYKIGPIWYLIGIGFFWYLGNKLLKNRK